MRGALRTIAITALISSSGTLGAGGCFLTSDFSSLAGTRPDDGGWVEGSPSDDGSASDGAFTDGPPSDAGSAEVDARNDSGCIAGEHAICTTFDDVDQLPVTGWQSTARSGTLVLDTNAVTTPHALRVQVKGAADPAAYLVRDTTLGTFSKLGVSFDFKVIDCPAQVQNSLTLVYLGVAAQAIYGFVILSSGTQAFASIVNGTSAFYPLEPQVPTGAWKHLALTMTSLTSTTIHLAVTVDGTKALDTDAPTATPKSTLTLNLGAQGVAATVGCEVAYDNFVLDKQ